MRDQPALLSRLHCWGLRCAVSRRQAAAGGQQTWADRLDGKIVWLGSSPPLQPLPSHCSLFHSLHSCCYPSHGSVHCCLAVFPRAGATGQEDERAGADGGQDGGPRRQVRPCMCISCLAAMFAHFISGGTQQRRWRCSAHAHPLLPAPQQVFYGDTNCLVCWGRMSGGQAAALHVSCATCRSLSAAVTPPVQEPLRCGGGVRGRGGRCASFLPPLLPPLALGPALPRCCRRQHCWSVKGRPVAFIPNSPCLSNCCTSYTPPLSSPSLSLQRTWMCRWLASSSAEAVAAGLLVTFAAFAPPCNGNQAAASSRLPHLRLCSSTAWGLTCAFLPALA